MEPSILFAWIRHAPLAFGTPPGLVGGARWRKSAVSRRAVSATLACTGGAVAIALARDWLAQSDVLPVSAVEAAGYAALLAVSLSVCRSAALPLAALGIGRDRLLLRFVGGLLLGGVLTLPALRHGVAFLPLLLALPGATAVATVEELLFRGVFFALLERDFGGKVAVVWSSLAFAIAHAALYTWPVVLLGLAAGLLLGVWRLTVGDLVAPLVGHALADAVTAALLAG